MSETENVPPTMNPIAKLLAAFEAVVDKYAIEQGLTITDIIGCLELFKHQMLSEARDGYKKQVETDQIRKEVNYFG